MQVHIQNGQVKFVYQDHRVKVKVKFKVTGAERVYVYAVRGWRAFD